MLEHVVKLAVIYNCKIAISGYEIIDGDRSSNVIRTPRLLVPKDTQTPYRFEAFSERTVSEFQSIITLKRDEKEEEADRLWFCNRWGPLQNEKENNALFDALRSRLLKYQKARANKQYLPFNIQLQSKFVTNSEGRQIPAIECGSLYTALETSWFLSFQHEMQTSMCKFFKEHGDRKNCNKYFTTREGKEFCGEPCRKAYWQKEKK